MSDAEIRKHCAINKEQGDLLQNAMEQLALSARAYNRILKVARTIADLAASKQIGTNHLLEAIQYRSLDRNLFYKKKSSFDVKSDYDLVIHQNNSLITKFRPTGYNVLALN